MFNLNILLLFGFILFANVWGDLTTLKPHHGHAKPWEPQSRPEMHGWTELFQKHIEESKKEGTNIQVIFYGDSITYGWTGHGKEVWKQYYGHIHAVNYGIGADHTQHVLWRILNGEVEGLSPKVVVLKIGTNNLGVDSDDDIAHGIKAIVEAIHKKLPHCKVLLLGILPRDKYHNYNSNITRVNSLISKYDNGNSVRFLNMGRHFVDVEGHLILKLYNPDKLHLMEPGYRVWAETMDPLLKEMLKGSESSSAASATKPWEPELRPESWWQHMHENFLAQTKKDGNNIQIVFIGASLIQRWREHGNDIWEKHYAHLHSVNYGIGGDKTQQIIWRLEHNEVDGLKPKLIVLNIGSNNLAVNNNDDIVHGIKAILDVIHIKLPHTKVLLLGLLPRGDYDLKEHHFRIKTINSHLAKLTNGVTIQFLDLSPHFEDKNGHLIEKIYLNDKTHLTKEGYEIWAKAMDPLLHKMIQ